MPEDAGRRASGRVGILPAVSRILRDTRRTAAGDPFAVGVRVYSAGREIRQAGRPPYPMHTVTLTPQ